ncbi:MAG: hypothetical protein PHW13_10500 [Methylococcales bacterium]|nr:hypothetical protein [Methylococcales bacterium]
MNLNRQINTDNRKSNLPLLSNHFHVSSWVIARRALALRLINEYWTYVNKLLADYKAREKEDSPAYNRIQIGKASKRLGARPRIENLLRKSPYGRISCAFSLNSATIPPQIPKIVYKQKRSIPGAITAHQSMSQLTGTSRTALDL